MFSLEDYVKLLNDGLNRGETIVLGCECAIRYSGRAESLLKLGDRIIMLKADKSLLVHQPTGNAPINYMKPGTAHTARIENNRLVLRSQNLPLKEFLMIEISRVHFFNTHRLEDSQEIIIAGTEADMAEMIYTNPELVEPGFKPVSQEEQTKYGFIDVLGVDSSGRLTVVECKRYCAELSAVTQLRRYVEKLMISKGISKVRGILAAPRITPNAKQMLEDWGFEFKTIRPPKYLEEFDKKQSRLDSY